MSAEPVLDKRNERIQKMFAAIAPQYDFLNHALSLNVDRLWRKRTVRLVPAAGPEPVLDVCTGTGDLALMYARATAGRVPVVGSDFCFPMLARAGKKSARRGAAVTWVEADAQELPFADNTFQVVTNAFGLRNVADPVRGLAEMARVAVPGGAVAVLEFSRPRVPVLSGLYRWYFRRVLPTVGQVVSASPDGAYSYLPASVMQFPDGDDLLEWFRGVGLADCWRREFTLGVATLYVGRKPLAARPAASQDSPSPPAPPGPPAP